MKLYTTIQNARRLKRENPGCFIRARWVGKKNSGLVEGIFIPRTPLWLAIQTAIYATYSTESK